MNKNRSSRWLFGATWFALGSATLIGCSVKIDDGEGGVGGAGGSGDGSGITSTSGSWTTTTTTTGSVTPTTTTTTGSVTPTTTTTTGVGGADATTTTGVGGAGAGGSGEGGDGAGGLDTGAGGSEPARKFVGNITTNNAVRPGFATYWDQITPENEGKWGSVEPSRGQRNWGPLDAIYKYAKDNNIIFKHHVFVWGSQQPSWIGGLPGPQQETAVKDWMKAFCERYPDTKYIDVVNEPPPHTTPSYKNGIGGDGASGWDWIVNSFKWAREYCPNAVLILNDYNNIEYEGEHQNFMRIAKAVIDAGAPVDALGAQAHDAWRIGTNQVKKYIDNLASLGKPVYITEYDIGIADDNRQKQVMEEQFTMFWNHPAIPGITLWGYIVGATWRDNTGIAHPVGNDQLRMRPAMTWLMEFLGRPTQ
ncbi:endoglucanase [Sorangium cellulosum]|uniref:Beta-xylanase n=1 Tax=Sorangium cellulosum TaxID=56 RepID=A0A4P2QCG4_SORCE|nr:endo-1,4-beta-xylanase [Sorangium cellulosum]AUX27430.1 endoglucanase [Sorangium cellulosum]